MTQFNDQLRLGAAYYEAQAKWNGGGMTGLPFLPGAINPAGGGGGAIISSSLFATGVACDVSPKG